MPREQLSFQDSSIRAELEAAGTRDLTRQHDKKNYAELLSRRLAQRFADALRPTFPAVLPNSTGGGQESRARTVKGFKKLDVNFSTVELGLGFGVSIKTINFRDAASARYTKNYTRVDGELRAEASDYHVRQPFAVMVAVIFLPEDCCDDGSSRTPSSFGQAVQIFRFRGGREEPTDDPMLFERVYVGLYSTNESTFGSVGFFDVMEPPPRVGRPAQLLTFSDVIQGIIDAYDARNSATFVWADSEAEKLTEPVVDPDEDDLGGDG